MKIKCPRCRKWTEWRDNAFRPFCSERCKLIDLGAWVSEEYRIESEQASEGEHTSSEREDNHG